MTPLAPDSTFGRGSFLFIIAKLPELLCPQASFWTAPSELSNGLVCRACPTATKNVHGTAQTTNLLAQLIKSRQVRSD
jgi:hypothetical protein